MRELFSREQKARTPRLNGFLAVCVIAVSSLGLHASAQQTTPQQPQAPQNLTPEQEQTLKSPSQQMQALQEQALQKLTPAQSAMVRPLLLQAKPPAPGGDIRGFVEASLPGNPHSGSLRCHTRRFSFKRPEVDLVSKV